MRLTLFAIAAIAAALPATAFSQEPPGRVGRLAYVEGAVSIHQDVDGGWESALLNTPLTSENSVATDAGSRAEIRVSGTAMRLSDSTQLDISRLDDDTIDATVASGSLNVRVRYKQREERYAIGTPQATFVIDGDGAYRIDFDPAGDESRLTVTSGSAHLENEAGDVTIGAGQTIRVYSAAGTSYGVDRAEPADDFDRWAQSRDGQWRDVAARRHVSAYMTGYEDLDSNGQWSSDPDYGDVWMPSGVDPDWAPYSEGRWAQVQPWGWTWIDAAPWGYAPFHYGRWIFVRNRWAWAPGQRVDRPVYAPALVAWVGGPNWSVGTSGSVAAVGWYPLAPWERYQPWYRAGGNYANRVNVAVRDRPPRNWTGSGDAWRRWNRDHATTVVNREALTDRRDVGQARLRVSAEALRRQSVVPGAQVTNVLPQRSELVRTGHAAPRHANPAARAQPSEREMARDAQQTQQRAVRDAQQAREAQQRGLQGHEPQPADLRDAAKQQERAQHDSQRDAQQEAQLAQQREALRRTREAAQAREREARDAQQQQQRAAREARDQQEHATQQQQQRTVPAQREAQQQAREAEQAQRDAQQQAQRNAREMPKIPPPSREAPQPNPAAKPVPQANPTAKPAPQASPATKEPPQPNPAAREVPPPKPAARPPEKEKEKEKEK